MPCAPMTTAVLTPITSARELTSGPPELPGLSAAWVWMIVADQPAVLGDAARGPTALTMPAVTVDLIPSGLPMAMADLAGLDFGVAEPRRRQTIAGLGPQYGDAVSGSAEHARGHTARISQRQLDGGGALDHVIVGEHDAVGRQDGAGARASRRAALARAAHLHVHDGRGHGLDHAETALE